jgi:hypothetical protein
MILVQLYHPEGGLLRGYIDIYLEVLVKIRITI